MPGLLDALALLILFPTLLPRSTSSPLPNPTDAIAALVHTIHTTLGFRLIPSINIPLTGPALQDRPTEEDFDDGASETATAVDLEEDVGATEGQLPTGWNARGEDSYVFEYRHSQSAMSFRVRVGRMGGRVQIDAMAENGAPHTVSVVLGDLLTPPAFPIPSSATATTPSSSSTEAPAKSIGFKSVTAVQAFTDQYKADIVTRLLPGLRKEGYTESTTAIIEPHSASSAQTAHDPQPSRSGSLIDPIYAGRHPSIPYTDVPPVGRRDLDPLAAMRLPGLFNPQGDGGGMYVDFNHPLFDSRRRRDPDLMGGPGGSIQPPGARWDPVGPGMGGGGGLPGAGRNPMGGVGVGDPGWGDELPPPGEFGPDLGRIGGIGGMGGTVGMGGIGGMGLPRGPGRGRVTYLLTYLLAISYLRLGFQACTPQVHN
ncbi:MAG: hypothetical protein TREMPRED_000561 [Tremellales sp. Tagirdzhanova-0007]|nr:MAG: hypothetical protein TREMPRED_000561 [Tremellales sp. Tagirdzhanova-0007]